MKMVWIGRDESGTQREINGCSPLSIVLHVPLTTIQTKRDM